MKKLKCTEEVSNQCTRYKINNTDDMVLKLLTLEEQIGMWYWSLETHLKFIDILLQSDTSLDRLRLIEILKEYIFVYEHKVNDLDLPVTSKVTQVVFQRGLKTPLD